MKPWNIAIALLSIIVPIASLMIFLHSDVTEDIGRVETSLAAHKSDFVSFKDAALVQHGDMKADLATLLERSRPSGKANVASADR